MKERAGILGSRLFFLLVESLGMDTYEEFTDEDLRLDSAALVFSPENFTNPITSNSKSRAKLIEEVADWLCKRQFLLHPDTYDERVNTFVEQLSKEELQQFLKLFDNNIAEIVASFDNQRAMVVKYRGIWKDKFLNGRNASENFLAVLRAAFAGDTDDRASDTELDGLFEGSDEGTSEEQAGDDSPVEACSGAGVFPMGC